MSVNYYKVKNLLSSKGSGIHNYDIIKNAIEWCVSKKIEKMVFPEGVFEVYNKKALDLYDELLTGSLNSTDYDRINEERNVMFDISDIDNFEITGDGKGTVFKFNGLIAPFDFCRCKWITLSNIMIDWIVPPFTETIVKNVTGNTVYVTPCEGYHLNGGEPIVSTTNIITETGIQGGMAMYSGISNISATDSKDLFSFTCEEPEIVTKGETLILRHIYGFAPAIHFYLSSDIKLENVTLYAVPGMGLICQKSRNITVNRCSVKPSGKRKMSINCDATHFIGCRGKIKITNSYFEAMGDDTINVHTFYLVIQKKEKNRIIAKQFANSQDGIPYIPSVNDKINFVNANTLKPYAYATVTSSEYKSKEKICIIETKEDIPEIVNEGDCLFDADEFASLHFANCISNNVRGRGVLFSSDGAVIENNEFRDCTCEGVLIPCGSDPWWEGTQARNVKICNNLMINCGKAPAKYCSSCGVTVRHTLKASLKDLFENIVISNNRIIGKIQPMYITSVKNLTVKDNSCTCESGKIVIEDSDDFIVK